MGILAVGDVEKVTRKFRAELNPGKDGEVQIPTEKYLTECLVKGWDYQFAMTSYQKQVEVEGGKEKAAKEDHGAEFVINKRKLGIYKGTINKILMKVDAMEVLRTTAKMEGVQWEEKDHVKLRSDMQALVKSLPEVEVSKSELRAEVRVIKVDMAKAELKKLQDQKKNHDLTEEEMQQLEDQKKKLSVEKAATKMMKIVQSNRRRSMETREEGGGD